MVDVESVTFHFSFRITRRSDFYYWGRGEGESDIAYILGKSDVSLLLATSRGDVGGICHADLKARCILVVARQNRSLSSFNGKVVQLHRYRRSERRFGFPMYVTIVSLLFSHFSSNIVPGLAYSISIPISIRTYVTKSSQKFILGNRRIEIREYVTVLLCTRDTAPFSP